MNYKEAARIENISFRETLLNTAFGALIARHKGKLTHLQMAELVQMANDLATRMYARAKPDWALQFSNAVAAHAEKLQTRLRPYAKEMKIDEPKTKTKKAGGKKKRKQSTTKSKTS
jgi:hypothetical protein